MKQDMNWEKRFLEICDGTLSVKEREMFDQALAEDEKLRAAWEGYLEVVNLEGKVRARAAEMGFDLSSKVMLQIDDSRENQGFFVVKLFRRLYMKLFGRYRYALASAATVVTVLICLHVGLKTDPESISPQRAYQKWKEARQPEVKPGVVVALPIKEAGEVVMEAGEGAVSSQGSESPHLSSVIPPGYKAVTIKTNATSSLEGWARDGLKVDLHWQANIAGKPGLTTIVQNSKILSAERRTDGNTPSSAPAPATVTMLVTELDAQKIALAQSSGSLHISLRGDSDGSKSDSASGAISINDLLGRGRRDELKQERLRAEIRKEIREYESKWRTTDEANAGSKPMAVSIEARKADEERITEKLKGVIERMSDMESVSPAGRGREFIADRVISSNTAQYNSYVENSWITVSQEPKSTFSIDVDTASYANVRRFLRNGQLPPSDAVRIEEFLNYFDYNYPIQTEQPFSLTYEIAPSPLEPDRHLLKLGIKARDAARSDLGWNLVFLVDVSGSMSPQERLPLVKQALRILVDKMRPEDRIAIVTYAGSAGLVLDSTAGSEKSKILTAIEALGPGGSTYGSAGIKLAYEIAERNRKAGAVNRVILATDGDFNVGVTSQSELVRMIGGKRVSGITLTTIGVGTDNYKDGTLEQLANKGNGNYFYLDSLREARKVMETNLTANMEVVAKDVKLQIEFNPAHVRE